MTKQEQKKEHCKNIVKKYEELGEDILEFEGLDDNSEYYHPLIKLDDTFYLRGQCDLKNEEIYGFDLRNYNNDYRLDLCLSEELLKKVFKNKDFYMPKITEKYEIYYKINEIQNLIKKKLEANFIDIFAIEQQEKDINDYLEIQKMVKDVYKDVLN
jgi:hypothetical protein